MKFSTLWIVCNFSTWLDVLINLVNTKFLSFQVISAQCLASLTPMFSIMNMFWIENFKKTWKFESWLHPFGIWSIFFPTDGPIKKRSASLSSDADFSHRFPNLNSSVPSSLAEESDFDSASIDGGPESKSSRCSAGTLISSTGSTTDSDSLWSCPKCKKVMKKKCSYRHVKEVHGQNREIVQCPVCFRLEQYIFRNFAIQFENKSD